MAEAIGVRYRDAGHICYLTPGDSEYVYSDKVLVESQQSSHIAAVVLPKKGIDPNNLFEATRPISYKASQVRLEKDKKNKKNTYDALRITEEKVQLCGLEVKMIKAKYTSDRNRLIFFSVADGRIDLRELAEGLAAVFRARTELRRIGVHDEAKIIGGIGLCGRPLCCSSSLGDFVPMSIGMAEDQGLSSNPTKISGLCGRLMCCLRYKSEEYGTVRRELPDFGEVITVPSGKGKVIGLNLFGRIASIRLTGREDPVEYEWDELKGFIQVDEMNG